MVALFLFNGKLLPLSQFTEWLKAVPTKLQSHQIHTNYPMYYGKDIEYQWTNYVDRDLIIASLQGCPKYQSCSITVANFLHLLKKATKNGKIVIMMSSNRAVILS